MPHRAPHRIRGAQRRVAPQESAAGQRLHRPRQDGVGHVGQRSGQLRGRHPVRRGEQHHVEHLQGGRVQFVQGTVHRHGDGEPAGQGGDLRRPDAAGDVFAVQADDSRRDLQPQRRQPTIEGGEVRFVDPVA